MPWRARGVSGGEAPNRSSSPWTRTVGGVPAVRCRSDPFISRSFPSNSGIGTCRSSSGGATVLISLHHPCNLFQRRQAHPCLLQPVVAERHHPLLDRDSFDGIGRGTPDR